MFLAFIRLQIFVIVRIVTMIIRAVEAENYTHALEGKAMFSEGLLIAEQVCRSTLGTINALF